MSLDGHHFVVAICKVEKMAINSSEFCYRELTTVDFNVAADLDRLLEYTGKVLDALGIVNGPAHSEIMITKRGPVLIETGARLHGGMTPTALSECYTHSQVDLTIDAFLRPHNFLTKSANPSKLVTHLRLVFSAALCELEFNGFDEVWLRANVSSFHSKREIFNIGDILKPTMDIFTCPGWIVLRAPSLLDLDRDSVLIRDYFSRLGLY